MALKITKLAIWAAEIQDQPGGLAGVLEKLAGAGANLECVIARRQFDKPGTGVVFLTPIKGRKVQTAAQSAGLMEAKNIATLRVEGPDRPGIGARITRAVAETGVNIRGVSAVKAGGKFIAYIGLDSSTDADKAARAIKALDRKPVARRKPARR